MSHPPVELEVLTSGGTIDVRTEDEQAVVTSKLAADLSPLHAHTDIIRGTDKAVLTPLNVQATSSDLQSRNGDKLTVRVSGTIRPSGGWREGVELEKKIRYLEANPPIEQHRCRVWTQGSCIGKA